MVVGLVEADVVVSFTIETVLRRMPIKDDGFELD
jgi:hypothetical protein